MDAPLLDRLRHRFFRRSVLPPALADKDVVAGIYPLKRENWPDEGVPAGTTQADFERMYTAYTVNTGDKNENGEIVLRVDEEGFMKVDDAPTGFMVIKRSVFEK